MKKLLLTLLLAVGVAQAATVATTKNEAGGMAVLTDLPCEGRKDTFIAYTVYSGSRTLFGCWAMDDNFIFIRWSDGDVRTYPFHIWDIKTKKNGGTL